MTEAEHKTQTQAAIEDPHILWHDMFDEGARRKLRNSTNSITRRLDGLFVRLLSGLTFLITNVAANYLYRKITSHAGTVILPYRSLFNVRT